MKVEVVRQDGEAAAAGASGPGAGASAAGVLDRPGVAGLVVSARVTRISSLESSSLRFTRVGFAEERPSPSGDNAVCGGPTFRNDRQSLRT